VLVTIVQESQGNAVWQKEIAFEECLLVIRRLPALVPSRKLQGCKIRELDSDHLPFRRSGEDGLPSLAGRTEKYVIVQFGN
jgi:hypothetical protein